MRFGLAKDDDDDDEEEAAAEDILLCLCLWLKRRFGAT